MALLLLLTGLALWWLWPRKSTDIARARRLLGLQGKASAAEIEAAFRAAAFKAHPDHGGSPQEMHRLTAARDLLLASVTKSRQ